MTKGPGVLPGPWPRCFLSGWKPNKTAERDGETWFCLADVCRPLDLAAKEVRKRLKEEGVVGIITPTNGGSQKMLFVNEGNLYRAIFQSHKLEAERFTDWVTEEVLPAIAVDGRLRAAFEGVVSRMTAQAELK